MEEIKIEDYFIELTDEGRGTIGYNLIGWKTNELMDKIFSLNKAYKQKEKECEELKKFCIELEKQKTEQHLQWQKRCTENHLEDTKQIDKLEQTLQEIKEIVEPILEVSTIDRLQGETYTGKYILAERILQKISEVEE